MASQSAQSSQQPPSRKTIVREIEQANRLNVKVVATGGGSGHILNDLADILGPVDNLSRAELEFWAFNTDWEDLSALSDKINAVQFGKQSTGGFGAGEDVNVGRKAALDDMDKILDHIGDADFVLFLICGGKGTSSGGGPEIVKAYADKIAADTSKRRAALVIATEPFKFEGLARKTKAENALAIIRDTNLPLAVIPNQLLMPTEAKGMSVAEMLNVANKHLAHIVARILHVMANRLDLWNADWNDIMNVLRQSVENPGEVNSSLYYGVGYGKGENRMLEALTNASTNPTLRTTVNGCHAVFMAVHSNNVTDIDWAAIENFLVAHRTDEKAKWLYGIANQFEPMDFEADKSADTCVTMIGIGYTPRSEGEQFAQEKNVPAEVPVLALSDNEQLSAAVPAPNGNETYRPRKFDEFSYGKASSVPTTLAPATDRPRLGTTPVHLHYGGLQTFSSMFELVTAADWNNPIAAEILGGDMNALTQRQKDGIFLTSGDNMAEATKLLASKDKLALRLSTFWRKWVMAETVSQRSLLNFQGLNGDKLAFQLTADMALKDALIHVREALHGGIHNQEAEIDVRTIGHLLHLGELWGMNTLDLLVIPIQQDQPPRTFFGLIRKGGLQPA